MALPHCRRRQDSVHVPKHLWNRSKGARACPSDVVDTEPSVRESRWTEPRRYDPWLAEVSNSVTQSLRKLGGGTCPATLLARLRGWRVGRRRSGVLLPSAASWRRRSHPARTICVVGQHGLDYPRNVVNQRLMRAAGYSIELCHSRAPSFLRTLSILSQYWRVASRAQIVFATEGSHRHLLWLKLASLRAGHKIIFDPFISLYNTEVEDRKLHAPLSPKAWLARWRDFCSCWCASCLVFDTSEHKNYFFERYRLGDKPYRIIPIGVDENTFHPRHSDRGADGICEVLFYGTYIPLQGIDVIVAAAHHLRGEPSIRFTLIGDGQERRRIETLAERLQLPNVTFIGQIDTASLASRIARADVCLGIFDAAIKASQVVPNKVVQCAAMKKTIITRTSPAIVTYFEHDVSALLIPPGDSGALARAIMQLAAAPERRAALAREARRVFEQHFSQAAQVPMMKGLLSDMLGENCDNEQGAWRNGSTSARRSQPRLRVDAASTRS